MIHFQHMKKRSLFLWVLLLSIALLCAQGVNLHLHGFGHEQGHSVAPEFTVEHSYQSGIHLTTDTSHSDHHDEVISELDASPQALLKKISSNGSMQTIFIITFTFLFHRFYVLTFHRRRYDDDLIIAWRYILSPPLRAPPL